MTFSFLRYDVCQFRQTLLSSSSDFGSGSMRCYPRIIRQIVAVGVAASAVLLPLAAAQAVTPSPQLTATPSVGLTGTTDSPQTITVSGTDFAANKTVTVIECNPTVLTGGGAAACDLSTYTTAPVSATGSFSTPVEVHSGTVGNKVCDTVPATHPCLIAATTDTSDSSDAAASATLPISFAPVPVVSVSPSSELTGTAASPQTVTVTGTGFAPDVNADLVECNPGVATASAATAASYCDATNAASATVAPDGTIPAAALEVHGGTVGNGTCTAGPSGSTCVVVASATSTDTPPVTTSAVTAVTFASTGPLMAVTPSTNLKNRQTVKVSGSGFGKSQTLVILECTPAAATSTSTAQAEADCDVADASLTHQTDGSGAFSNLAFTVKTGALANSKCDASHSCVLFAATLDNTNAATAHSDVPLTFAKVAAPLNVRTTISAKVVKVGKKLSFTGTIKAAGKGKPGLAVVIYDRASNKGKWHTLVTLTSRTSGAFAASLKNPKHVEQYTVKHANKTIGGKSYRASSSRIITVKP
jgi:Neocarzinostatin family